MRKVLYALAPIAAFSVWLFGWRAALLLVVANAAAFLTEYAFVRQWKQPVTSAVFVSGSLFALSLPPLLPLWMAALGAVFAVLFGKMVFGGFGRNVFNPALTGRAFLYVCFGVQMTAQWSPPFAAPLGGLAAYAPDAVTQATPGILMKSGGLAGIADLALGTTSGCLGGTSAILAIAGGLYLVFARVADYRIVVSAWAGFFALQTALWLSGVRGAAAPLHAALASSVPFGFFYFATDPVSASQTAAGKWFYGAFVGAMTVAIAVFSAWPAGGMFAILLGNMFAPIGDYAIKALQKRPPARSA